MRRFGNPKWNVSHDYRKYPEGWSSDEGRDPQLEYRISIMHAVKDDSGIFTCVTPARHTHAVEVIVKVGMMFVNFPFVCEISFVSVIDSLFTATKFKSDEDYQPALWRR